LIPLTRVAGRSPNRLIYFNFEDERLAGFTAPKLHIIPDTHLRMFPEPASEPITLFLDEIRALQEAGQEHPRAGQTILTLESRLPFPFIPEPINVLPAWQWMFDASH
jgi:hypothetical protein